MNEQPEALRLADMIERYNAGVHSQAIVEDYSRAADELRRLHEADEAFGKRQEWWNDRMFEMETALRQAVEALEAIAVDAKTTSNAYETARQAIAAAKQALGEAMSIDAMKLALEALELWSPALGHALNKRAEAVVALRAAIEQAQEPVAWISESENLLSWDKFYDHMTPLYTAPRQWQGLTDEELDQAMDYWSDPSRSAYGGADRANGEYVDMKDTWRYIEAKLKEKNT
jgi:hypothetical protein